MRAAPALPRLLLALSLFALIFNYDDLDAAPLLTDPFGAERTKLPAPDPLLQAPLTKRCLELSFIAMAGFWKTDPQTVSASVQELLASLLPDEEVVWGPALHQPWPDFPGDATQLSDALAFMCRNRSSGDLTVVFRGTNPLSAAEWLFQDFMVQGADSWKRVCPGPAPEAALVSRGTASALGLRLALRPAAGLPGADRNFGEALLWAAEESAALDTALRFTGHSLGGLLAQVAALYLLDSLSPADLLKPASRPAFEVLGFAAPTAGNAAFASWLDSRVPRNTRYANDLDAVTHAWETPAFGNLPVLYEPWIDMDNIARPLFGLGDLLIQGRGYRHAGRLVAVPSRVVPVHDGLWLLEAVYQHVFPYLDLLEPLRRESIVAAVIEPLTGLVTVAGLDPPALRELIQIQP